MNNPNVFISYARKDSDVALAMDQWLRNKGARVLIDERDFIPGNDIEFEIVRCIKRAGKVVCIYSKNSAKRPYPELERKIAAELERADRKKKPLGRLIYFCVDKTKLPLEVKHRLAIIAKDLSFQEACEALWLAVLGKSKPPKEINLSIYSGETAPWNTSREQLELKKHQGIIWDHVMRYADSEKDKKRFRVWSDKMVASFNNQTDETLPVAIDRINYLLEEQERTFESEIDRLRELQNAHSSEEDLDLEDEGKFWGKAFSSLINSGLMLGAVYSLRYAEEKLRRTKRCVKEIELQGKHSMYIDTPSLIKKLVGIIMEPFDDRDR